jgi:hypothetical protein
MYIMYNCVIKCLFVIYLVMKPHSISAYNSGTASVAASKLGVSACSGVRDSELGHVDLGMAQGAVFESELVQLGH